MGALYAWCCMCYGWRIVVESASEIINSAKITQKVSTLLPPQELLSLRFDYNF